MKTWRIITLVLWSVFLTGVLVVSTSYLLAYQTILNEQALQGRMSEDAYVERFRTQVLIPRAQDIVISTMTPTPLVSNETIQTALQKAFSPKKTREIIAASLPPLHAWLDKKSPDIAISVPISTEIKTVRSSINDQVGAKLKALPDCAYYNVSPEVVQRLECMPLYLSAGTVIEDTMTEVDSALVTAPTEISADTLGLTTRQLGTSIDLPDYLSYLWALNLVTTPLAALTILYLILRRRGAGVFAIGMCCCALAAGLAIGSVNIGSWVSPDDALQKLLSDAITSLLSERMRWWGLIGAGSGLVMIVLGSYWIHASARTKRREKHYVSERAEE